MSDFTDSTHCTSRRHCKACRGNPLWRIKLGAPEDCPHGITSETLPKRGLGDIVESLAKPIAKALKFSCLDENQNLKPESPCAKRRDMLNKITG